MKKKELILVGVFSQPLGLKGEIKINIYTSSFESFKKIGKFFLEDDKSEINFKSLRNSGGKNYGFIKGFNDRSDVEKLKGKKIFAFRENFSKIKENEYYAIDLLKCTVIDMKKTVIGIVYNVKNFGAGDLLEIVDKSKKISYIPVNDDNIVDIDINNKKIIINPILGLLD